MSFNGFRSIIVLNNISFAAETVAKANCESDLMQLEPAFSTPKLNVLQLASLEEAKAKAITALRQGKDKNCNAAVFEGITKAGLNTK